MFEQGLEVIAPLFHTLCSTSEGKGRRAFFIFGARMGHQTFFGHACAVLSEIWFPGRGGKHLERVQPPGVLKSYQSL